MNTTQGHNGHDRAGQDARQGGAGQLDRQRPRVLRLLHLRHRRRARLRQGLLPRVRPRDRARCCRSPPTASATSRGPIGAFFMGHIGDKYGRKRVLLLTVSLMGTATFLVGCLPTYDDDRHLGADPARLPAPAAGLLRLRRAVGRELAQPRARPRAPARVLHQLHARRHAGRPDHRHRDLPADRRDARGPAAELGLAHPVLAERDRRRRRPGDPPPAGGAAGVPRGGRRGRDRAIPIAALLPRPLARRAARRARRARLDRQHDLRRLRAQLRRRHQGPRPDHDAVGRDRRPTSSRSPRSRRGRCSPTASAASPCSSSARSAAAR